MGEEPASDSGPASVTVRAGVGWSSADWSSTAGRFAASLHPILWLLQTFTYVVGHRQIRGTLPPKSDWRDAVTRVLGELAA